MIGFSSLTTNTNTVTACNTSFGNYFGLTVNDLNRFNRAFSDTCITYTAKILNRKDQRILIIKSAAVAQYVFCCCQYSVFIVLHLFFDSAYEASHVIYDLEVYLKILYKAFEHQDSYEKLLLILFHR